MRRSASESSWLCTTGRRWSEPLCEDKQLTVQDPCVRISTVDLCEAKQGNQSHLSRHVLPFFFHTITPTSNFYHTIPPLSVNIQFLSVIFPFLLTTWSVSRFYLESWDSNVIQLLLEKQFNSPFLCEMQPESNPIAGSRSIFGSNFICANHQPKVEANCTFEASHLNESGYLGSGLHFLNSSRSNLELVFYESFWVKLPCLCWSTWCAQVTAEFPSLVGR